MGCEALHGRERPDVVEHGEELAMIFEAQLAMLDDVQVKDGTVECIRSRNWSVERAFAETMAQLYGATPSGNSARMVLWRPRLTESPGPSSPRLVRRSVSGTTSTANSLAFFSVTVRHAPLTRMLSPSFVPSRTTVAAMRICGGAIAVTLPTSSTRPVNMGQPST